MPGAPDWFQMSYGYRHGCHDRCGLGRESTNKSTPAPWAGVLAFRVARWSVCAVERKEVPLSGHWSPVLPGVAFGRAPRLVSP